MDSTPLASGRGSAPATSRRATSRITRSRAARAERLRIRFTVLATVAVLVIAALAAYLITRPDAWKRVGPSITVSSWAPYWQTDSALASFTPNVGVFEDVSMFAYSARGVDAIVAYDGFDLAALAGFRAAADAAGVNLTASIIDDTEAGVMAGILADPATRATHVATIVALAGAYEFDGIDIDYEKFAFSDGRDTWEATRPNWVTFIKELAFALHEIDKTLTVSVPPVYDAERTGGDRGYWVYAYDEIGPVVDAIRIMAYDYSTSEPGPIAPIEWVENLVKDIRKIVAPRKLILGVPVYGYDWPGAVSGVCPADQQPRRRNVSTKSAAVLAAEHAVTPTFDEASGEQTFTYTQSLMGVDEAGVATTCTVQRTVWYADARAVHARAWIAQRQDLRGIAIWSLGSDDELVWDGIAAARASDQEWAPGDTVPIDTELASTTVP